MARDSRVAVTGGIVQMCLCSGLTAAHAADTKVNAMAKKEKLDPETAALIQWCTEVEGFLVAGGATLAQAQEHIEEQVEWFTDMFYDGLSPEEAAKAALSD
jgi:uncharacterized membrane protein (DUF4010 family)